MLRSQWYLGETSGQSLQLLCIPLGYPTRWAMEMSPDVAFRRQVPVLSPPQAPPLLLRGLPASCHAQLCVQLGVPSWAV